MWPHQTLPAHKHSNTQTQLEDKMKVQHQCCEHTEVKRDYYYHTEEILSGQLLEGKLSPSTAKQ